MSRCYTLSEACAISEFAYLPALSHYSVFRLKKLPGTQANYNGVCYVCSPISHFKIKARAGDLNSTYFNFSSIIKAAPLKPPSNGAI